jgi:tRNA(Arg) A34 adenosine deaminase TadA
MTLAEADERTLRRAIELAGQAREKGNQPFGSVLVDPVGRVVLEAENTAVSDHDWTAHAELNVVRAAAGRFDRLELGGCTLFASTEPCPMCAAAAYWADVGRIVYALGADTLTTLAGDEEALVLSCREVLSRGGRRVEVSGPHLEDEARAVHEGFW